MHAIEALAISPGVIIWSLKTRLSGNELCLRNVQATPYLPCWAQTRAVHLFRLQLPRGVAFVSLTCTVWAVRRGIFFMFVGVLVKVHRIRRSGGN